MSSLKFVLAIILCVGILYLATRNRIPDLHGMTIPAAEEFLKSQNVLYVLGHQVGFIEPEKGKGMLLGKIAEQIYLPSTQEGEPGVFDYKLYQIDVSKLPQYMAEVTANGAAMGDMDTSELVKNLDEIKKLAEEMSKRPPPIVEPAPVVMFPHVPEPKREVRKKRPALPIREVGFEAPRTDQNRLRFAVPDRPSTARSHRSKESFFW